MLNPLEQIAISCWLSFCSILSWANNWRRVRLSQNMHAIYFVVKGRGRSFVFRRPATLADCQAGAHYAEHLIPLPGRPYYLS